MSGRLRTNSLGSMFKKKSAASYQTWVDEEDVDGLLEEEEEPRSLAQGGRGGEGSADEGSNEAVDLQSGLSLVECFYLGAYEMEGRSIRGRGCIDTPAGELWEKTQEEAGGKKRRRSSRNAASKEASGCSSRPRYVKLVAVKDELEMRDVYSDEKVTSFRYRQISFVGTHPKYNRLFAFVAHEKGRKIPSCYAFKCEDKLSACTTAQQLDGVFHQRCSELLSASHTTPSPTGSVVTVQ